MKTIDDVTEQEWDALNSDKKRADDSIERPAHYNNGKIECIDAIEAMLTPEEYLGYLRGNSLKYRWRMRYKGHPVQDLRKAQWYENRTLDFIMENPSVLD